MDVNMGHDNLRRRWPTRKYSRCWRMTCWAFYYVNSWHFISAIWSLDRKLKSCAVNIFWLIWTASTFSHKLSKSQTLFWPFRVLLEHSGPKAGRITPPASCRALLSSNPSALQVALGQKSASSVCVFIALPDRQIWLKETCHTYYSQWEQWTPIAHLANNNRLLLIEDSFLVIDRSGSLLTQVSPVWRICCYWCSTQRAVHTKQYSAVLSMFYVFRQRPSDVSFSI